MFGRLYFFFYFSTKTSAAEISHLKLPKLQIFQGLRGLMEEAAEAPLCDVPVLHTGELVASDAAATAHRSPTPSPGAVQPEHMDLWARSQGDGRRRPDFWFCVTLAGLQLASRGTARTRGSNGLFDAGADGIARGAAWSPENFRA